MKYGVTAALIILAIIGFGFSFSPPQLVESSRQWIDQLDRVINSAAWLSADQNHPISGNDTPRVRINKPHKRDLSITKSHTGNFTIGQTGTYNIVVTNVASDALGKNINITVTDTLPAGLTLNHITASGWTCDGTNQVTCTYRTTNAGLPSGASLPTIALTVNVLAAAAPGVTNVAYVSAPGDTNHSNDDSSDPTLVPSADLAVVKSINTISPSVGEQVIYTIIVTNYGPSAATNARLTDLLPAALAFDGYTASQGSYDSTSGAWTFGSLAKDASATLSLYATVKVGTPDGSTITNTTSALASDQVDLFAGNDSSSVSATVRYVTDLQIHKSHSGGFIIGGSGTFSLVVTNTGSAPAAGAVIVTDDLSLVQSDGLIPTEATGSGWTCMITGKLVACTNPNSNPGLLPNASLSPITLSVDVSPALVPGSKTNTASVSFSGSGSSSASDTVTIDYSSDLGVTKSAMLSEVPAGAPAVYTVMITNAGPSSATNVRLTDSLPAGLVYGAHAASRGSYDPVSGLWTLETLAKNDSATLTLIAYVDSAVPSETMIVNTAGNLSSDQADPNASNNSANAALTVTASSVHGLDFFKAQAQMSGFIHLSWGTLFETNTYGFNLYRSQQADGPYTRLNASLILAHAPGSPTGSEYTYIDTSAVPGITYYYKLEFVDQSLAPSIQGMLSITGRVIYLPVIARP